MNRVSGDRIRHELDHILGEDHAAHMLARLDDLALLAAIHPDLQWDEWINEKILSLSENIDPGPEWNISSRGGRQLLWRILVYALWFIRLTPERARAVMGRLRLAATLRGDILQACKVWHELPDLVKASTSESLPGNSAGRIWKTPSRIANCLDGLSALAIYSAYLATDDPRSRELLHTYVTRWQNLRPALTGDYLRSRGIPPGPIYSRILTTLRNAWLDGEVSTAAQEADLFEKLLRESPDELRKGTEQPPEVEN